MYTGRRDTRVTIERRTVVRNSLYGNEEVTWSEYATAWVQFDDVLVPERNERGIVQATRHRTMELPMIYGVDTSMRVHVPETGELYQIVAKRDLPKRVGIVLDVETYSSAGV